MAYLTKDEFTLLSPLPAEWLDDVEASAVGFIAAQLAARSGAIDARLRKRYAVPFELPAPEIVRLWLCDVVTLRCLWKKGVPATDEIYVDVKAAADSAEAQILEAANATDGLFDLPLVDGGSAISRGGPRAYTEASPYVGFDSQSETGRNEDRNGRGTSYG
jgi:phage gp36-like protein